MFQMWDWIRFFKGYHHDWVHCIPGCLKHEYSINAKKALVELKVISRIEDLDEAKPEYHRVCRIACWKHLQSGTCTIITTQSESNMAQHIIRKGSTAPGLVTLFRYVSHLISSHLISSHLISSHLI